MKATDVDHPTEARLGVGQPKRVTHTEINVDSCPRRSGLGRPDGSGGKVDPAHAETGSREEQSVRARPAADIQDPRSGT